MKEENQTIIRAINKFGRVPQTYELLNMIDDLQARIDNAIEYIETNQYDKEIKFENKKYYSEYFKNKIINILKGEE